MTNFEPNTNVAERTASSATLTIGYITSFIFPVVALGIGIAYTSGNFNERSKGHGKTMIIISLIVGGIALFGRLSNPY